VPANGQLPTASSDLCVRIQSSKAALTASTAFGYCLLNLEWVIGLPHRRENAPAPSVRDCGRARWLWWQDTPTVTPLAAGISRAQGSRQRAGRLSRSGGLTRRARRQCGPSRSTGDGSRRGPAPIWQQGGVRAGQDLKGLSASCASSPKSPQTACRRALVSSRKPGPRRSAGRLRSGVGQARHPGGASRRGPAPGAERHAREPPVRAGP